MIETTPWAAMLSASLRLGVAPEAFWRLGLKEWRAATGRRAPPASLPRTAFDALIASFPDQHQ